MKQKTVSSFIILSITLSLVLCTFFVSPITASKTLKGNEFSRINQCEKKFWWKSREDFDKTLKKLCMKPYQDHHNNRKKRFRKGENCDKPESWNIKDWERKKNTWESRNKEGKYKSLNKFDKVRSKSSQKLLWKQFQKVSDCKCSVLKFKVSNPVGISVCHQIISINKADGNFVSMITVFRSFERDEFKGKHAFLGFKYDRNIKVKSHGLKKLHDDFLFGSKSLFTYKGEDSDGNPALISKIFVLGEIPKKTSMNKIDIDVISPIAYKVVVQISKNSKKVLRLKSGKEFKNIPVSKFTLYSPFAPYFNGHHNKKDGKQKHKTTSSPTTSTNASTYTLTSSSSSTNTPTYTPTPSVSATGTSTSPDAATDTPTGTSTSPDAATDTPTDTSTDTGDSISDTTDTDTISNPTVKADNAQQTTNNVPVPGQQINAAPIGLVVFGVVVAIGAAFVGYTTYERRRYRKQFNQREKLQQQNPSLAAVPDLGRAI